MRLSISETDLAAKKVYDANGKEHGIVEDITPDREATGHWQFFARWPDATRTRCHTVLCHAPCDSEPFPIASKYSLAVRADGNLQIILHPAERRR